jgi:hypothetical protein
LREACELANEELGVTLEFDQDPNDVVEGSSRAPKTDPLAPRLAARQILTALIKYPKLPGFSESEGTLIYGRAVLTLDTPDVTKAYAREKIKFPNDPTGDQWFDVDQFNHYLWLGRRVGELAAEVASADLSVEEEGNE